MISSFCFTLSAFCFVAMFLPQRPTRPRQELETYYVCDPESLPTSDREDAELALAGESRG